jgi:hypothetical protein
MSYTPINKNNKNYFDNNINNNDYHQSNNRIENPTRNPFFDINKNLSPNDNKFQENQIQNNTYDFPQLKFEEILKSMKKSYENYLKMGLNLNALFYAEKIFYLSLKKEEEIFSLFFPNTNLNFSNLNCTTFNINQQQHNDSNKNNCLIYKFSEELYNFAYCLYMNKEYFRCVNLIQKYNMKYYNIKFLNLLGQALYASEDYESVILNLDKDNIDFIESKIFFF